MKSIKEKRGITLIALAVTLVVILILAGVTIDAVFSEDGIINKAKEAANSMNNAVANDQAELNDLLEELNEIMNSEWESNIEIPDPEPPKIGEVLKEGDYVYYTDSKNVQRKYIVLYGPENENYYKYGIQIVSDDILENIKYDNIFNDSKEFYNNAIVTLNKKAEEFINRNNNIVESARCVGSNPSSPLNEAEYFSSNYNYMKSYNNIFKDKDNNYETDINQLNKLGISRIEKNYWLASRYVNSNPTNTFFGLYIIDTQGEQGQWNISCIYSDGSAGAVRGYVDIGLRVVFTLNKNCEIVSGDGSDEFPYSINVF